MNLPLTALAYRPFLDPIPLHEWWWLMIVPLAFGIAVVYKAVRLPALDRYWKHVVKMTVQILGSILAIAVALFVLVEWIVG